MSGKRTSKGIVISWVAYLCLSAAGCAGGHHGWTLMHPLRGPCVDAPPVVEVPFHGYHATCWHRWPEGWVGCPEDTFEESESVPRLEEPMPAEPMPDPAAGTELRGGENVPANLEPSSAEPDSAQSLELVDPNARRGLSPSADFSVASYIHVEPPREGPLRSHSATRLPAGLWDPVKPPGRRVAGLTLRR